jgi:hypothetical protein
MKECWYCCYLYYEKMIASNERHKGYYQDVRMRAIKKLERRVLQGRYDFMGLNPCSNEHRIEIKLLYDDMKKNLKDKRIERKELVKKLFMQKDNVIGTIVNLLIDEEKNKDEINDLKFVLKRTNHQLGKLRGFLDCENENELRELVFGKPLDENALKENIDPNKLGISSGGNPFESTERTDQNSNTSNRCTD